MSEADKMFEKLGYTGIHLYKEVTVYYNEKTQLSIQFDCFNKTFCKFNEADDSIICDFNMQELQAINKKVEELGLLDE